MALVKVAEALAATFVLTDTQLPAKETSAVDCNKFVWPAVNPVTLN